jgi:competence protein ComEC
MRPLLNLIYLQVGMLLLLMPLQVLIFHGFSFSSLVANLFAVPLVTFVSVPLILLGMLLHLLPLAAESAIWFAADKSLAGLFWLLMRLPDGWQNVDQRWQSGITAVAYHYWLAFSCLENRSCRLSCRKCLADISSLANGKKRELDAAYAGCGAGAGDGH